MPAFARFSGPSMYMYIMNTDGVNILVILSFFFPPEEQLPVHSVSVPTTAKQFDNGRRTHNHDCILLNNYICYFYNIHLFRKTVSGQRVFVCVCARYIPQESKTIIGKKYQHVVHFTVYNIILAFVVILVVICFWHFCTGVCQLVGCRLPLNWYALRRCPT